MVCVCVCVCVHSQHSWGLVAISALYLGVLTKSTAYADYFMLHDLQLYTSYYNQHAYTATAYQSCIELNKEVHLNNESKILNDLFTVTCTYFIIYNCFYNCSNLGKAFIK